MSDGGRGSPRCAQPLREVRGEDQARLASLRTSARHASPSTEPSRLAPRLPPASLPGVPTCERPFTFRCASSAKQAFSLPPSSRTAAEGEYRETPTSRQAFSSRLGCVAPSVDRAFHGREVGRRGKVGEGSREGGRSGCMRRVWMRPAWPTEGPEGFMRGQRKGQRGSDAWPAEGPEGQRKAQRGVRRGQQKVGRSRGRWKVQRE